MSNSRHILDDDTILLASNASMIGMPLVSIGALLGVSPSTFYQWCRIGEVALTLHDQGLEDDQIASQLGGERAFITKARSLYQSIARGRALGEQSAYIALDTLVKGIDEGGTVPTITPSLPAIKLRLGMSVHYNDTQANTHAIEQSANMPLTSSNRMTLDDLQRQRDATIERTRLLAGNEYEISNDDTQSE